MNCSAYDYGGAVYLSYSRANNCVLSNCNFILCNAGDNGGAAYLAYVNSYYGANDCVFSDCSFIKCSDSEYGGGIYFESENCSVINSEFIGNTASEGIDWYSVKPVIIINDTHPKLPTMLSLTVNDVNFTVNHEITLIANVNSKLDVNEGTVHFFDGETNIGESQVDNGIATLNYTLTTAGKRTIAAIYESNDCYQSSNDTALLIVDKADVDLNIADIASVYFSNPSNFAVTINSNFKAVNEGKIKYYVNDVLVGSSSVSGGASSYSYTTDSVDSFDLIVFYEETDNYLASNTSTTFTVDKMPTTLSGETTFFDEDEYKTYTTELVNANGQGVANQLTKIEVIKYSGESRTFTDVSDSNGTTVYDIDNLEGGMWIVKGIFDENDKYIGSTFTDRFIVIRMNTTTTIEEITNPRVNHTYKLKANIHDENGKLVKEGIVQFYLDGVDIGSIDLSKNQGHQNSLNNGLLGAANILGDGEDDLYIEYTPTQTGKFTLSAVYEGTTVYKSSNQTTAFVVQEDLIATSLTASDVTMVYNGGKNLVATLKDASGKVISGAKVTVKVGDVTKTLTTDANGQVSLSLDGMLPNEYNATITYGGDNIYDNSSATAKVIINKLSTTLTSVDVTMFYNEGKNLSATLKDANGKAINGANVTVKVGNITKTLTTDKNGQVSLSLNGIVPNTYTATINFDGDEIYAASSASAKVTINKQQAKVYLRNALYFVLQTKMVQVTLWDADNKPLAGKTVSITLNEYGWTYYGVTDENGNAYIRVGVGFGVHSATVTFDGDENYTSNSKTGAVRVIKETPSLMLPGAYTKFKASDATKTIKVYLKDRYNKPLLKDTKVFVTINGKQYVGQIDSEGIASININLNKAGVYNVDLYYTGNTAYNAVRKTTKITIV